MLKPKPRPTTRHDTNATLKVPQTHCVIKLEEIQYTRKNRRLDYQSACIEKKDMNNYTIKVYSNENAT